MGKHGAQSATKLGAVRAQKEEAEDAEPSIEQEDESDSNDDGSDEDQSSEHSGAPVDGTKKKRKKSKAPVEVSATKPVGRFRQIVPVPKKGRDPRFESFTGRLNQDLFRKSYAFVDDVRQAEVRKLRDDLTKEKDEEKREVIRTALQLLQQQVATQKRKDEEAKLLSEAKHAEREKVAQGKKPFFMKKGDKRNLVMMKKLEALEQRGGLDKFMEKRLKRRAQKDHKRMPRARVSRDDGGGGGGGGGGMPFRKRRRDD